MRLKDLFTRMVSSARPTVRRFWASIFFSVAMTTTLIMSTHNWLSETARTLNRFSLTLTAGLLASWCAILFYERRLWEKKQADSELTGNLIALAFGGLATAATYPMLREFTLVSVSRHAAICIFLALAFFVIPNSRRGNRIEMYGVRVFTQAVIAALFSAVMFFGLSSITLTVSSLFSLKIEPDTYLHIWMVMAGVVAPFLLMAGIPAADAPVEAEDYPKTLRNLVLYVITPLIATYTLVLFIYFAKILVTWQWPIGLVSHLVLWYSLVSIAVLYFVWPLGSTNKWAELFSKYFTRALIPLLLMMFLAIGIRIHYYGITENRYYVTVLGLWVFASVLYLNLAKKRNRVLLPGSLAVVVALSVFGPWSSFAVSKWSQNQRLEGLLTKNGMVAGGSVVLPAQEVPATDRREMAEILSYFDRYHELSDVKLLPAGFTMGQFEETFGFSPWEAVPEKPTQALYYEGSNRAVDIAGYEHLFDFTRTHYDGDALTTLVQGEVQAEYNRDTHRIAVWRNGSLEWEQSLVDYARLLNVQHLTGDKVEIRPEDMIFEAVGPSVRLRIVVTNLYGGVDGLTEEVTINQIGFLLLVGVN